MKQVNLFLLGSLVLGTALPLAAQNAPTTPDQSDTATPAPADANVPPASAEPGQAAPAAVVPAPAAPASGAAAPAAPASGAAAPTDSAPRASKSAERIQVTGSRIRQIDTEGPKPVVSIGRKEIEQSGAKDVNEILNNMTLSSFGSASAGSSNGVGEGTQSLNLRGLGSGNTLVLLNGRRIVRDPSLEFIDLSVIPSVAVEKIEIVKGTASAIYGTDALSGVVNIITRKDYDGMTFGFSKTVARMKGGDRNEGYIIAGSQSDRTSNVLTLQWTESLPILGKDRPWADTNYRSRYGRPFSYENNQGDLTPVAPCDDGSRTDQSGTFCTFNYWDRYQLQGSWQKLSALDDFSYQVNDNTTVNLRLFVTNKSAKTGAFAEDVDPSRDGYRVSQAFVQANHADIAGNAKFSPDENNNNQPGVLVQGRFLNNEVSGTRTDQLTYSSYLGMNHTFNGGQQLELGVSDSRTKRTHIWANQFDDSKLRSAVFSGELDVLAPVPPSDLTPYQLDVPDTSSSIAQSAEATYSGEFDLLAKTVGYSLGVSHIRESYSNHAPLNKLAGQIKNLGGGGGEGERKANAVFGEVNVPIAKGFDTSLAARLDDYSDFGSTFNPMLGLQYRYDTWLYTRVNYGTGFKAPTLRDLHDEEARYYASFTDYRLCNQATASGNQNGIVRYCEQDSTARIRSGGNKELKPETSQSINLFVGIEPVVGTGVSFEYFQAKIKDVIKPVDEEDLMQIDADNGSLPLGTAIIRDPVTNEVVELVSPTSNLSTIKASGLDTSVYTRANYSWGRVSYRSDYSYYLSYEEQKLPGGKYEQRLEESETPRFRWNNTFGYGWGKQDLTLISRTNGRYQKSNKLKGFVGSFTSWDLNYAYAVTDKFDVQLGANNVFNTPPLKDDSENVFGNVGSDFYPAVGPTVYTRVNYTL